MSSTRKTSPIMPRRISPKLPPVISYIWIGPPSSSEQDVIGPRKMASVNSYNEIFFVCLEDFHGEYCKRFAGLPIRVLSVQSLLQNDSSDPLLAEAVKKAMYVGKKILGWGKDPTEFTRGAKYDFVSFKEFISLVLLKLFGGYVLDTNVSPEEGIHSFQLPHGKAFTIPFLSKAKRIDYWMMYAPKNDTKMHLALSYYLEGWDKLQEMFKKHGGYTEKFHNYPLMTSGVLELIAIENWEAIPVAKGVYSIPTLKLKKTYNNTHHYKNREQYENPKFLAKNNFMLFTHSEGLKLPTKAKSVIFEYAYADQATDPFTQAFFPSKPATCFMKQPLERHVCADEMPLVGVFRAINENNICLLEKYLQQVNISGHVINNVEWKNLTLIHFAILHQQPQCLKRLCLEPNVDLFARATDNEKRKSFDPLQLAESIKRRDLADIIKNARNEKRIQSQARPKR